MLRSTSANRVSLGIDSSSVITVTVINLGNAEVSGSLTVSGQDTGLLVSTWVRLADGVETDAYTPGALRACHVQPELDVKHGEIRIADC